MARYRDWLLAAVAIACAFMLHIVDIHTDDTQFPFFMLLGFTFNLGLIQPWGAWRWGLLVGMGVTLPQILAAAGLYALPYRVDAPGSFLILGIALAGAYAGVLVRRMTIQTRSSA